MPPWLAELGSGRRAGATMILVFYGSYRSDRMGIRLADYVVRGLAAKGAAPPY